MKTRKPNQKKRKISAVNLLKLGGVLVVCIYVTCILVKQQINLSQCDDLAREYQTKIDEAKLEQQKLEDELKKADTDDYIESVARERLGLVKANERVFVDITQE